LGGKSLQRFRSRGLLFGDWEAREPAQADRGCTPWLGRRRLRPQVKIVFRKENTAAVLGYKRVRMRQLAPWFIHLQACPASKEYGGNTAVVESGGEFGEAGYAFAVGGNQVVHGDVKDEGSVMQSGLRC